MGSHRKRHVIQRAIVRASSPATSSIRHERAQGGARLAAGNTFFWPQRGGSQSVDRLARSAPEDSLGDRARADSGEQGHGGYRRHDGETPVNAVEAHVASEHSHEKDSQPHGDDRHRGPHLGNKDTCGPSVASRSSGGLFLHRGCHGCLLRRVHSESDRVGGASVESKVTQPLHLNRSLTRFPGHLF